MTTFTLVMLFSVIIVFTGAIYSNYLGIKHKKKAFDANDENFNISELLGMLILMFAAVMTLLGSYVYAVLAIKVALIPTALFLAFLILKNVKTLIRGNFQEATKVRTKVVTFGSVISMVVYLAYYVYMTYLYLGGI